MAPSSDNKKMWRHLSPVHQTANYFFITTGTSIYLLRRQQHLKLYMVQLLTLLRLQEPALATRNGVSQESTFNSLIHPSDNGKYLSPHSTAQVSLRCLILIQASDPLIGSIISHRMAPWKNLAQFTLNSSFYGMISIMNNTGRHFTLLPRPKHLNGM